MIPRLPKICTQLVKCIYIGISLYILIIVTTTSPSSLFFNSKAFPFFQSCLAYHFCSFGRRYFFFMATPHN